MAIWHAKAKRRRVKIVKRKEQKFLHDHWCHMMPHDVIHVWFHVGLHRWCAHKCKQPAFVRCFAWRCHQCREVTLSCRTSRLQNQQVQQVHTGRHSSETQSLNHLACARSHCRWSLFMSCLWLGQSMACYACCGNHTFSWQLVAFCVLRNFQVKLDGPCYVKVIRLLYIVSLRFFTSFYIHFWWIPSFTLVKAPEGHRPHRIQSTQFVEEDLGSWPCKKIKIYFQH